MQFPVIDYREHPAFAPYVCDCTYDEALIARHVDTMDTIHRNCCGMAGPSRADADDALSQIRRSLEAIVTHVRDQGISLLAEEWLHACTDWVLKDLRHEYLRKFYAAREYEGRALSPALRSQLDEMNEQGGYIAALPANRYADIRRLALEHLPDLKARALSEKNGRAVVSVTIRTALGRAIRQAVKESGVLDVLSEYKQNRMTMMGAGLEYSCSEQNWYQNLYSDVGLPGSPFQYLHVDEADHYPKSMIYVTPVAEENGPTRVIPGSHRWERSELVFRMHKALDKVVSDRYARYARGSNYRPLSRHPELRRVFMEMPRQFQGSSHFGDDVLADSELAKTLGAIEQPFISQGSQTLVFDGPRLLHRGSLVRSGERMALQVVYRNQNDERLQSLAAGESWLREQAALTRKYVRKLMLSHV